jgi:uncharacterized protein YecA (UPF0149 family)
MQTEEIQKEADKIKKAYDNDEITLQEAEQSTNDLIEKFGLKKSEPPARVMKLQRNAPCPCGSGKKYKKCHMKKYNKTNFSIRHEQSISQLEEMIG